MEPDNKLEISISDCTFSGPVTIEAPDGTSVIIKGCEFLSDKEQAIRVHHHVSDEAIAAAKESIQQIEADLMAKGQKR